MKRILAIAAILVGHLFALSNPALAQNIEDRRYVCMMQDSLQVKPGEPVSYKGKTYYGCCPMCAQKMTAEPDRYLKSIDPVSKATVDKATALIYGHNGAAFYFESEANRKKFAENPSAYIAQSSKKLGTPL